MRFYIRFSAACSMRVLMFFLLSILPLTLNALEVINSNYVPIALSTIDRKKFEDMSCMKLVGAEIDKIYAQTTKGLHFPTDVFIDCKPHNKLDGYPLRISISCSSAREKWSCEYPALQALTTMSEQKIVVSSDPKEIHGAIDIVKYLNKSGKFTNSNFLKNSSEENICSAYEFKNSKWSVQCNKRWGFDLKQLCEGDRCNWEIVSEGPVLH